MGADHGDRFGNHRVYLAGHDAGARLQRRQFNLPDSGKRARIRIAITDAVHLEAHELSDRHEELRVGLAIAIEKASRPKPPPGAAGQDPRVRLAFSFQSKYLGMSPFKCPSLFTILSFLEHEYGVFHPVGGCGAVMEAMARVARDLGVDIRTGEEVKELEFRNRRPVAAVTATDHDAGGVEGDCRGRFSPVGGREARQLARPDHDRERHGGAHLGSAGACRQGRIADPQNLARRRQAP